MNITFDDNLGNKTFIIITIINNNISQEMS